MAKFEQSIANPTAECVDIEFYEFSAFERFEEVTTAAVK